LLVRAKRADQLLSMACGRNQQPAT